MKIIHRHRLDDMMAASPSQLVVMLYDEAIGALETAVAAIAAGDIEARCNAVTAATEIVGYLYMHLDLEQGGEVAQNLGTMYAHLIGRMTRVNLYNDAETAREAVRLLQPLRNSWHRLDRIIVEDGLTAAAIDPALVRDAAATQASLAE